MENKTENVSEEIQEQASVHATEAQAQEIVAPTETQEVPTQSDKEYNFNQMRKSQEQLQNRIEELVDQNKKLTETSPQAVPAPAPLEDLEIGDEDLVEGKHLNKMYQEINSLRNELIPERLRTKFSDFDEVVTKKNIEKLKLNEPELFASVTSGTDLYRTAVCAYKTIKGLGIVGENFSSQKDQIQNNHNRPVSTQAIKGQGALSEKNVFAGGLTDELKKQLQQEMSEAVKAH